MIGYLRLEVVRTLRDPRYLILALAAPVGFYLLFAGLFGTGSGTDGLVQQVALMVSLAVFGAMWAVMQATGPRVAQDRSIGWARQLRLLPVRAESILAARLLAAAILAVPALALVMFTARISHGVQLDAWKWLALLALLWFGTLPFALLGIAVGYATGAESAFGLLYVLNMVVSALGGLWMPISFFPERMQAAGKLLPSYRAADLGWHLIAGQALDLSSVLLLAAWALLFALLAVVLSRRVSRSR
jgi:ABC-2 type transport system permease protein